MRVAVIVFPGSNCDMDCYHVLHDVIGVQVDYVWHRDRDVSRFDALVLPGGFSYGDYLRPGAIARFSPIMSAVEAFGLAGGPIIGICNGFQILCEAGLLPGALVRNTSVRFRCQTVPVRVERADTPFTIACRRGELLELPIAHGEGRYHVDVDTLAEMRGNGQIVFRYAAPGGEVTPAANPNGSIDNIAGIVNRRGNILGLMPHPERNAEEVLGSGDGRKIFESMVRTGAVQPDGRS